VNPNRENGTFYIVMTQPTFTNVSAYFACIQLPEGLSVVTSGPYQNYFIDEPAHTVFHHLIDPRTLRPGGEPITLSESETGVLITPNNAILSVSVLYEDGGYGDIYSTSFYLLTIAEGLAFTEANPGIEAIWYQADGTIILSTGLVLSEETVEVTPGVFKPLILIA
jgi:thiamine biosynthesis lipoprotein ApbE